MTEPDVVPPTNTTNKRVLTDQTGQDVINAVMQKLNELTVQDSVKKKKKKPIEITEADRNLQKIVEFGQNSNNCKTNKRGDLVFEHIWHGQSSVNFLHKHTVSEPWLFFWKDYDFIELDDGRKIGENAVACLVCHAANNVSVGTESEKPVKWKSCSVKTMNQIIIHRNSDLCKRSRAIVQSNFICRDIKVFNPAIDQLELTLKIPVLPFQRYQTPILNHIENQLISRSFKFQQIIITARAVRHCVVQGLAQRGANEDYSVISRKFDDGLNGVGNVHSISYLLQPDYKPLSRNNHYKSSQFIQLVNDGFLNLLEKVIDRETSHGKYLSLGDDGSTDISCQSIHLLSAKTNGKERIISAFHPEKGDAPGLAKSIMDELKLWLSKMNFFKKISKFFFKIFSIFFFRDQQKKLLRMVKLIFDADFKSAFKIFILF